MTETVLKDCPLCGGKAEMVCFREQYVLFMQKGQIFCKKCQLRMPIWQDIRTNQRYETTQEEAAIKTWNTRLK